MSREAPALFCERPEVKLLRPTRQCFERAKDDLGLDHCEARSWHGWHRHMSLCLAAAAFLARLAADLRQATWGKANERSPAVPAAA